MDWKVNEWWKLKIEMEDYIVAQSPLFIKMNNKMATAKDSEIIAHTCLRG